MHKTKNLDDDYLGSGKLIRRALAKYGRDCFKKEILFIFDNEDSMRAKEREIVNDTFLKETLVYNLDLGGGGGFFYCNATLTVSQKHKRAKNGYQASKSFMVDSSKNKRNGLKVKELKLGIFSEESISKRCLVWLGRKHTDTTKLKMSLAKKGTIDGIKNPAYGKFWITNGFENKMIKPIDIIPNGWYRGRMIQKIS